MRIVVGDNSYVRNVGRDSVARKSEEA